MGSDLAKRPSESAPTNRDSSESEKSSDSSRIRGVWNSGSNCKGRMSAESLRDVDSREAAAQYRIFRHKKEV